MKTDIPGVHTSTDPDPDPGPTPSWTFPEYTTWFYGDGPVIPVRFPDGIEVEFRPGTSWIPGIAAVRGRGIDIKGLLLDIDVMIGPDGKPHNSILRTWKTGVNGIDGAEDVAEKYRTAAMALCRKRAAEARTWLRACLNGPRP